MDPIVWGPCAWEFLHMITFNYPDTPTEMDKNNMKKFFYSLPYVLPCQTCGDNLKKHYIHKALNDDVLNNKKNLVYWLFEIHNMVNMSLGKKQITYDEFAKKYDKIINKKKSKKYLWCVVFLVLLIILILSGLMLKKYGKNNFNYVKNVVYGKNNTRY